ncbi:MAG: hypothetical protein M3Z19_13875 [Chloroflexota bacterium]|nr:hypothetical protein [Chloroflexota bacterium]
MAAQANAQENFRAVARHDGAVVLLDQTRLPHEEIWLTLRTPEFFIYHIQRRFARWLIAKPQSRTPPTDDE